MSFRRLVSSLSTAACAVLAWMVWDNVWSPVEPIQTKAEEAACTVKDCAKRHAMTKMDRMPYGQTFEYTWENGPVEVSCHRASYVFGPLECRHDR